MLVNNISELKRIAGMSDIELAKRAKDLIYDAGYVVIRNFGLSHLPIDTKKRELYRVLSKFGDVTTHDGKNYFWDIMYRGDNYVKNNITTFSEEVGECPLHSDSAFKKKPEDFLVMYVVQPAEQGGESIYLSASSVVKELHKSPQGKECLDVLKRKIFPFQTPFSFNQSRPIIYESILSKDEKFIRYRRDCIENGLSKNNNNNSLIKKAIEILENALNITNKKITFSAQKDNLIIIDNTRGLHSITHFDDPKRYFTRARVTEENLNG